MAERDTQTCFYQDTQSQQEEKIRSLLLHQSNILEDMITKDKDEKIVYKMRPSKIIQQKCYRIVDLRQQRIKVLSTNPSTKESDINEQLNSDPQKSKKSLNRDNISTPAQFDQGGVYGNKIQTDRRAVSRIGLNTNITVSSPKSIQFIATNNTNDLNQNGFQIDKPIFANENMSQTKSNFIFSEKYMKNFQNKRLSFIKDKSRLKNKGTFSQNSNYQTIQPSNNIDSQSNLQLQCQNQKQTQSNTIRSRSQCFLEYGSQNFQEAENQFFKQNENQYDQQTNDQYNQYLDSKSPLYSDNQIDLNPIQNQNLKYKMNFENFNPHQKEIIYSNSKKGYKDEESNIKQLQRSNSLIKENEKQFNQYSANLQNSRTEINFNNKYSSSSCSQRNDAQNNNKSNASQDFQITNHSNKFITQTNMNGNQNQQLYSIQKFQSQRNKSQKSENLLQNISDFSKQATFHSQQPAFNQILYSKIQSSNVNSAKYSQNSQLRVNSKSIEQDSTTPTNNQRQLSKDDNQLFEKILQEYSSRNDIFASVFQNKSQMIKNFQNKTQLLYNLQNKNQMVKTFQNKSQLAKKNTNKTQQTINPQNKSQIIGTCTSEGNRKHRKASSNIIQNKENNLYSKHVDTPEQSGLIEEIKKFQNMNLLDFSRPPSTNVFAQNKDFLDEEQNPNLVQLQKKLFQKTQIQNKYEGNYFNIDNTMKENSHQEKNKHGVIYQNSTNIMIPEEDGIKNLNQINNIKHDTSINRNKFPNEEPKLDYLYINTQNQRKQKNQYESKEKSSQQAEQISVKSIQRLNKQDEDQKEEIQKKYIDNLIEQMLKQPNMQNDKQSRLQLYLNTSINEHQVRNKIQNKINQQQKHQQNIIQQKQDIKQMFQNEEQQPQIKQLSKTKRQKNQEDQDIQQENEYYKQLIYKQIQENKENNMHKIKRKNQKDDEQYQQLNEYYNAKYKNIQYQPNDKYQQPLFNIKQNNLNENQNNNQQKNHLYSNITQYDKFEPWEQNDQNNNLNIDDYI